MIARADYDLGGGVISVAGLDIKAKQREMGLVPPASPMIPKPAPGTPATKSDKGDDKKTRTEQADKVREVILALEQEAAQLGRTSDAQELYNALAKAGVNLESDQGQAIAAAVNARRKSCKAGPVPKSAISNGPIPGAPGMSAPVSAISGRLKR